MTDSPLSADPVKTTTTEPEVRPSLANVLDTPPSDKIKDELTLLLRQLAALRTSELAPGARTATLERLYNHGMTTVGSVLATLSDTDLPIPIPRNTRQLVRSTQLLLQTLADDFLATIDGDVSAAGVPERTLRRSLHLLAQHLLISDLVASPATVGVWRQLHQTYETARRLKLTATLAQDGRTTLHDIYFSAVLLGCAQPASLNASEVNFVTDYLALFPVAIDPIDERTAQTTAAAFWIDPMRDATAFACSRKTAPPDTAVHYFSCQRLADRIRQQLADLEAGTAAQAVLPDFADTPAGRGVLRRLVTHWGEPGKRRFPRRRQNYRAILCSGLDSLWQLFQNGDTAPLETSNWMITNESPDGYAFMHLTGKTGNLAVGDVAAIRTETGKSWQICIVRWALSENQEHLELGLQILATRAVAARLARPAHHGDRSLLSALILPAIRALRATEMLVVPCGALEDQATPLILVVEKGNVAVREVISTHLDEQNSQIAIASIEPAAPPQST